MNDYTLYIQTKQKIDEMRRDNERRHWLRDALTNLQTARADRAARKSQTSRESGQHE